MFASPALTRVILAPGKMAAISPAPASICRAPTFARGGGGRESVAIAVIAQPAGGEE